MKKSWKLSLRLLKTKHVQIDNLLDIEPKTREKDFFISNEFQIEIKEQQTYTITKYVGISTNLNDTNTNVIKESIDIAKNAKAIGFHELLSRHINVWDEIWKKSDIKIVGDKEAQQGIRFNIFQLYQTYTGKNEKLNIISKKPLPDYNFVMRLWKFQETVVF